jgi:hypothetical protein
MIRIRRLIAALAAVLALAGPPALAADAEAIDEAKALMRASNTLAMVDQFLDLTVGQVSDLIGELNPGRSALIEQLMREHFVPEFRASYGELEGLFAELYARHFTAEEMRELRAFYDTPLGRKTLAAMPNLLAEAARIGQLWGAEIARRAMERLQPALEEHGLQSPNI